MPEFPDVTVYVERLADRIVAQKLTTVRLVSPFVLRTTQPEIRDVCGTTVRDVHRLGKQIVISLDNGLFLVIHLMVSGRLHWKKKLSALGRGKGLVAFDFSTGTLLFTEASKKKRASLHVVEGQDNLSHFDRGGIDVFRVTLRDFRKQLHRENHTLKRALTDPRLFSGIGNAYSDEILHRARMAPVKQTKNLTLGEDRVLFAAVKDTLKLWTNRLRNDTGANFPEGVTAFREDMAVHGRYRQPCPDCSAPIQRIVYAENEVNYCPRCQTGGKILADRSLSRLLKKNWPRNLDEIDGRGLGIETGELS